MPFTLYAPGTRKGNPFWVGIFNVGGQQRERSLGTTSKREAQQVAPLLEVIAEVANKRLPKRGEAVTFAQAARLYAAYRGLDLDHPEAHRGQQRVEIKAINRLAARFGNQPVGEIGHSHLVAAAN